MQLGSSRNYTLLFFHSRDNRVESSPDDNDGITLLDSSPGTSCPVLETVRDTDFCLLVTEPTLSGMHDLERVLGVCYHFGVPALVCINKYDINEDNTRQIERYCANQGVKVASKIPFDNVVTEALVQGLPVVEYSQGKVTREIESLWQHISHILGGVKSNANL